MKKVIILFSIICISQSAIAQRAVRIGSYEIIVRAQDQDTTYQVNVLDNDPCPPCPGDEPRPAPPRPKFTRYNKSTPWGGFGFIIPDNGSGYYTTLGGNSFSLDFGGLNRYYLARGFALGMTYNYTFYNYKIRDAFEQPAFHEKVLGGKEFNEDDIKRHSFRSHNAAIGVFMRCYLMPPRHRGSRERMYIDLGAQADWAFSKNYVMVLENGGKSRYGNDYAINPFYTSAVARIGWNRHALFVRYRLTEAFNKKELHRDLPPINVGIIFLN